MYVTDQDTFDLEFLWLMMNPSKAGDFSVLSTDTWEQNQLSIFWTYKWHNESWPFKLRKQGCSHTCNLPSSLPWTQWRFSTIVLVCWYRQYSYFAVALYVKICLPCVILLGFIYLFFLKDSVTKSILFCYHPSMLLLTVQLFWGCVCIYCLILGNVLWWFLDL